MAEKLFTQKELNRILTSRLKRERDRFAKEYESSLKRCMAQIHLMLYQEMCSTKKGMETETIDPLWSGFEKPNKQQSGALVSDRSSKTISLQEGVNQK